MVTTRRSTLAKKVRISPPAGVRKSNKARKGGFLPAALIPLAIALAGPIVGAVGQRIAKKIRGEGLIRAGSTRRTGGAKKKTIRRHSILSIR